MNQTVLSLLVSTFILIFGQKYYFISYSKCLKSTRLTKPTAKKRA